MVRPSYHRRAQLKVTLQWECMPWEPSPSSMSSTRTQGKYGSPTMQRQVENSLSYGSGGIKLSLLAQPFANPSKTWLIVKSPHLQAATELFHGTGVNNAVEGKRHLGAAVGRQSFVHQYVEEEVAQWVQELDEHIGSFAAT